MIYTKKLSDYALAGGSGMGRPTGWGGEGIYSQLNAMSYSPAGGYSQRSGMAGQPFNDVSELGMKNRMAIDKQINDMLGIQATDGIMGVPSGIGKPGIENMNVVTPKIAEKTQAWMQSKQADELATEKRELAKLQSLGEVYNGMLGAVKDPIALEALRQTEQFKKLEQELSDQVARVFGEQMQKPANYITPTGDLKKMPKAGSKVFIRGMGDADVTFIGTTIGPDGKPKYRIRMKDGTEGTADIEDIVDKPDRSNQLVSKTQTSQRRRMPEGYVTEK